MNRQALSGLLLILLSAFFYAAAAPIAKIMYAAGWTPEVVVFLRVLGAALVLSIPTVIAMHGRWHVFTQRRTWREVIVFGIVSVAGVQLLFFKSVEHLDVAIALLLEMTAPIMIVLWLWLRTRVRPSSMTFIGMAVAMAGLVLILNPTATDLHLGAVLFALGAAVCLSFYFLSSAKAEMSVPPTALIGFGMYVGAAVVGLFALPALRTQELSSAPMMLGSLPVTWWQAMGLIVLVTAGAYLTGAFGIRMIGATVASFVNLIEVPFSVVIAWVVLAELPVYAQVVGGVLVLAGVVFIKLGENRQAAREVVVREAPAAASVPTFIEHITVPEAVLARLPDVPSSDAPASLAATAQSDAQSDAATGAIPVVLGEPLPTSAHPAAPDGSAQPAALDGSAAGMQDATGPSAVGPYPEAEPAAVGPYPEAERVYAASAVSSVSAASSAAGGVHSSTDRLSLTGRQVFASSLSL